MRSTHKHTHRQTDRQTSNKKTNIVTFDLTHSCKGVHVESCRFDMSHVCHVASAVCLIFVCVAVTVSKRKLFDKR